MRKGRSSRRSRISRPLVSVKGEALSTDIGPASSGHPSPRVVVGVPPSDPPPSESIETPPAVVLESKAPMTTRSVTIARGSVVDREEHLPPPPSEPPLEEKPAPEPPKVDLAATIVDNVEEKVEAKAEEKVAEPAPAPKVDLAATVVQGSSEAEKVEKVVENVEQTVESKPEPAPSFAKTLAFGSKINELPQSERVEAARDRAAERSAARDRLKAQREKAQEAQKAVSPSEDPDEISVPPVNDIDVEDEKFFSEAEVAVRKSHHEFEMMARAEAEELVPEKARRKLDPHVIRRRERFVGYVKIAVAGAAIVCLAAIGRSAIHSRAKAPAEASQAIAAAPETPPVAPKAAEPAAAPAAPSAEAKPAEEAKPVEPVATPEPAASAEPAKEEITGDAKEELKKSRTALEKRKIADAIEAGEKSVALDPTSGEAWLILGAAYQEKGDMVNARRCYGACVKQGKTGPRLECQKMLRF